LLLGRGAQSGFEIGSDHMDRLCVWRGLVLQFNTGAEL
jgi:hypothetical protein